MNNLFLLGLIAGGFYLVSNQKKTSNKKTVANSSSNGSPSLSNSFTYTCGTFKVNNKEKFRKDFVDKVEKIKAELNINIDTLFKLDPVIFAKKFIEQFNKTCANKDPKLMTNVERILFYGLAAEGIKRLEAILAIKDYDPENIEENEKYIDLKGVNCAEPGLVGCEYVIDTSSENYKKWQEVSQIYYNYVKGYLGLINQDDKISEIWNQVKQSGHYP